MPIGLRVGDLLGLMRTSAADGAGSPEGWCAPGLSAVADSSRARRITSRDRRACGPQTVPPVAPRRRSAGSSCREEDAELLYRLESHLRMAIVDELAPG